MRGWWINSPASLCLCWDNFEAESTLYPGVPQWDWAPAAHRRNLPHNTSLSLLFSSLFYLALQITYLHLNIDSGCDSGGTRTKKQHLGLISLKPLMPTRNFPSVSIVAPSQLPLRARGSNLANQHWFLSSHVIGRRAACDTLRANEMHETFTVGEVFLTEPVMVLVCVNLMGPGIPESWWNITSGYVCGGISGSDQHLFMD